jgi:hypothetical protein
LFPSSTTEVNEFEITVLQEQTNGSNYTSWAICTPQFGSR